MKKSHLKWWVLAVGAILLVVAYLRSPGDGSIFDVGNEYSILRNLWFGAAADHRIFIPRAIVILAVTILGYLVFKDLQ